MVILQQILFFLCQQSCQTHLIFQCYARWGGPWDEVGTLNVCWHPRWEILANFEHKCWPRDREVWTMGSSRKYSYLYHRRLLGFPKGRGVLWTGILKEWGVFTIGNPKPWGGFTGGISRVERVEWVPWKRYCCRLLQFVNKPRTYDHGSRRQASTDQTHIYTHNL